MILNVFVMIPSAILLMRDFENGVSERWRAAGVTPGEIIVSRLISQFFVMVIQLLLLYVVMVRCLIGYNPFKIIGVSVWTVVLLQGLQGVTLGLFIGSVCRDEIRAVVISVVTSVVIHGWAGKLDSLLHSRRIPAEISTSFSESPLVRNGLKLLRLDATLRSQLQAQAS